MVTKKSFDVLLKEISELDHLKDAVITRPQLEKEFIIRHNLRERVTELEAKIARLEARIEELNYSVKTWISTYNCTRDERDAALKCVKELEQLRSSHG